MCDVCPWRSAQKLAVETITMMRKNNEQVFLEKALGILKWMTEHQHITEDQRRALCNMNKAQKKITSGEWHTGGDFEDDPDFGPEDYWLDKE